eukprot:UN10589
MVFVKLLFPTKMIKKVSLYFNFWYHNINIGLQIYTNHYVTITLKLLRKYNLLEMSHILKFIYMNI